MPETRYTHLPLRALVSFEAAARHVSFKAAARELNVTPAAVSHQIKALEAELRSTLFERHNRGVDLTEKGAYLLVAIQRGFDHVGEALDQLKSRARPAAVTIHSTTAVSSLWLTQRLASFWRAHPRIAVSQAVDDMRRDAESCDLSIHYGDMALERAPCQPLFRDTITALASPDFAREHTVSSIKELGQIPLIHLEMAENNWTSWEEWAGALGYHGPLQMSHRVNNYVIALQAARDGMGAVLGWDGLTSELVASGRLVRLLPDAVPSPLDFYIAQHNEGSDKARLVFEWLSQTPREARP
ncbi:MAG: LysR substrate-binding domain-containing protein [Pseudomonadota bacterium]